MIPGFLMATLNPGRKTRRGRKRRRLTAWQREVKRCGGVMQAVRARRAGRRGRGKRRRHKRNPFLTTTGAGGAAVMSNAKRSRRRRRKIRSRRSAVSGRRRSSRSRRAATRRSKMARKTRRRRRRTPPRGRGGRFMSRRHRSGGRRRRRRSYRRNPVLPISWNPRRRRRRRSRRNPLFRSRRSGRFKGRGPGRQLHRRRRRPHYWHNQGIQGGFLNNGRRRRRRRSYRRNSVLPISWNPLAATRGGAVGQVLGRVKSFISVPFWTETGVPAAVGFFGSKAIGTFIIDMTNKAVTIPAVAVPFAKMAANALGGAGLAYLVGRFYNKKAGDAVWLGTVVNVAHTMLKQLLGGTAVAKAIGLEGLGDDLERAMREQIAARVQNSLNGMGSYLRTTNLMTGSGRLAEYVNTSALQARPGYAPGPGADLRDYDIANQETGI